MLNLEHFVQRITIIPLSDSSNCIYSRKQQSAMYFNDGDNLDINGFMPKYLRVPGWHASDYCPGGGLGGPENANEMHGPP